MQSGDTVKCGYIYKLGKVRKSWKKRWMVFHLPSMRLIYYDRPPTSGGRPKGDISVNSQSVVMDDRSRVEDDPGLSRLSYLRGTWGFRLASASGDRIFFFRAAPDEAMRWVELLRTAILSPSAVCSLSQVQSQQQQQQQPQQQQQQQQQDHQQTQQQAPQVQLMQQQPPREQCLDLGSIGPAVVVRKSAGNLGGDGADAISATSSSGSIA